MFDRRQLPIPGLAMLALIAGCGGGGGGDEPVVPPPPPPPTTNDQPRIAPIDDGNLPVGDRLVVTVSITDANAGDSHTLEATSADPCIAGVTAAGASLSITGRVAGDAEITVSATDDSGAANASSAQVSFTVAVTPPEVPDWALPRAAPVATNTAPCAVGNVLDHIYTDAATQAALLLRDGRVIGERYADGYDIASLGTSWSVAKSMYSAAVGAAIDTGAITSLDQRASDFFEEWVDTAKHDIRVRDLLEMRAGLPESLVFFLQTDMTEAALRQPPFAEPGMVFQYSNLNSQLFEPLILRATGMNAHTWLREKILAPIGIDVEAIGMWFDPTGQNPLTYCCIDMRPDDFARFGQLYLNGGVWDGQSVLSADYVTASLTAQSEHYGFQWWVMNDDYLDEPAPLELVSARGLHGQRLYVSRAAQLVLVVLTKYQPPADQNRSLGTNIPNTCAGRNLCGDLDDEHVPEFDEDELLYLLGEMQP